MKKYLKNLAGSATAFTLVAVLSACSSDSDDPVQDNQTPTGESTVSISAALTGTQSVPPVSTLATGTVDLTLNTTSGALSGNIAHTVTDSTVAHVHSGAIGQTGAPIVALTQTSATEFTVPDGAVLTTENINAFVAGNLYVNVHSNTHVDGEIRGQLTEEEIPTPTQSSLNDIQAAVFTPICSVCHTGGGTSLPAVMDLSSAENSFISLVSVSSLNEPEFERVTPSNPDASYLVKKLEDTHSVGFRMPLGGAALDSETIESIRQWIAAGAVQ